MTLRGVTVVCLALLAALPAFASEPSSCGLYAYRAVITRVIDGDTVVADIDLGFHTWRRDEHLRLIGIDAPEKRGETREAGLVATAALKGRVEGRRVTICTEKDERGKYGRYLAWIFLSPEPGNVAADSINAWMVRAGYAVPYGEVGELFRGG